MKFQHRILINFVTHAWMDAQKDTHTHGQAKSNMPLQLFQSWGHKKLYLLAGNCSIWICTEMRDQFQTEIN